MSLSSATLAQWLFLRHRLNQLINAKHGYRTLPSLRSVSECRWESPTRYHCLNPMKPAAHTADLRLEHKTPYRADPSPPFTAFCIASGELQLASAHHVDRWLKSAVCCKTPCLWSELSGVLGSPCVQWHQEKRRPWRIQESYRSREQNGHHSQFPRAPL